MLALYLIKKVPKWSDTLKNLISNATSWFNVFDDFGALYIKELKTLFRFLPTFILFLFFCYEIKGDKHPKKAKQRDYF